MDKTEEAKANLKKLRGPTYTEDEIVEEIDQCVKFTELESSLESSSSYVECFKGTDRRRTMIAMLMMMGQQCQGTAFLAGYITYFFGLVSDQDPFISAVIATSMAITGTLVAIPIIKYVPRRTLLLVGAVVSGSCMLLFAIVNEAAPGSPTASKFIIACICIFSFSYSASWGSLGPVIVGEIGSNRLRTKTVAIGTGAGFLLALIVITTIPYLIGATYANLGTRVGFVFGGLTVLIMVVTYFYLPETKDRTLEELDEMFINVRSLACALFVSADEHIRVCRRTDLRHMFARGRSLA